MSRNRVPSVVLSDSTAATKCECGSEDWKHATNGDGSGLQCCVKCGRCVPFGRYYQDSAVGVRVIQYSYWSALNVRKPEA